MQSTSSMSNLQIEENASDSMSMLLTAACEPYEEDLGLGWDTSELGGQQIKVENSDVTKDIKQEPEEYLDSLGNSPSSLFSLDDDTSLCSIQDPLDCYSAEYSSGPSFTSFDMFDCLMDPTSTALLTSPVKEEKPTPAPKRPVMVRKRMRECSMVCWLFRTLLTSEYRALPLNAIFEIFEDTNPSSAHGRHWRQSIRHCLMSSAVFVRVLTPNPRKDFLVMNEAGSWWTVHPDCESSCAHEVFIPGLQHKCPPNGGGAMLSSRMKMYRVEESSDIIYRDGMRGKWMGDKIFAKRKPLQERPKKHMPYAVPMRRTANPIYVSSNPHRGDHLVVDHEEEVIG